MKTDINIFYTIASKDNKYPKFGCDYKTHTIKIAWINYCYRYDLDYDNDKDNFVVEIEHDLPIKVVIPREYTLEYMLMKSDELDKIVTEYQLLTEYGLSPLDVEELMKNENIGLFEVEDFILKRHR